MNALGFAHQITLHEASSGGQDPMVDLLFEQGAFTKMQDPAGDTKSLLAVRQGHRDTASILLEGHANTNTLKKYGSSLLVEASARGWTYIANMLMISYTV